MTARLLFVHALSPLHAGTGQGVGVIDLPIAREKATGLPFLPGSSVKGTLRDTPGVGDAERRLLFGPETRAADEHAGSVQFSDQRLLLLPVRSLAGTFAWITSPYVLRRFARDARDARVTDVPGVPEPRIPASEQDPEVCAICEGQSLLAVQGSDIVVLEDLDLVGRPSAEAAAWATWLGERLFPADSPDAIYWQKALAARLCIVRDDILDFLLTTATEVFARVRLKPEEKTVAQGGLWYEEALPAETVLAGLVVASPTQGPENRRLSTDEIFSGLASLTAQPLQFGGKATVGRGLCRAQLV